MTQYYFLKTWLQTRLSSDERGANMVEYVLLLALIAVVVIVAVAWLGTLADETFQEAGSAIDD